MSVDTPTLVGDINLDNKVNRADMAQLVRHLGSEEGTWETGDFDRDGATGLSDLVILRENLGARQPAEVSHVVPEPTSLVAWTLLGITIIGLGWRRRRQRIA